MGHTIKECEDDCGTKEENLLYGPWLREPTKLVNYNYGSPNRADFYGRGRGEGEMVVEGVGGRLVSRKELVQHRDLHQISRRSPAAISRILGKTHRILLGLKNRFQHRRGMQHIFFQIRKKRIIWGRALKLERKTGEFITQAKVVMV